MADRWPCFEHVPFLHVHVSFADALHKISALEGELARLKAQIAVYALSESQSIASVPPPPPPPPPMMAQVCLQHESLARIYSHGLCSLK